MRKYEVTVCEDGVCQVLGAYRDEAKAKKKAAKEAKRRAKRHMKEKIPTGRVHAEVRGVDNGMYDTDATYELEVGGGAPKPRRAAKKRPLPALEA
jgi:hypothetical protein